MKNLNDRFTLWDTDPGSQIIFLWKILHKFKYSRYLGGSIEPPILCKNLHQRAREGRCRPSPMYRQLPLSSEMPRFPSIKTGQAGFPVYQYRQYKPMQTAKAGKHQQNDTHGM